jgi:hypothetical protein
LIHYGTRSNPTTQSNVYVSGNGTPWSYMYKILYDNIVSNSQILVENAKIPDLDIVCKPHSGANDNTASFFKSASLFPTKRGTRM